MIRKLNNQIVRLAKKADKLQAMADGLIEMAHKLSDVVDGLAAEDEARPRKKRAKKG